MRISVNKDDPGSREDAYDAKVFLDGKELKACYTADEEMGMVHCFKQPLTECSCGSGRLLTETLYGNVKVVMP